jgi:hypothetical protein
VVIAFFLKIKGEWEKFVVFLLFLWGDKDCC